MLWGKPRPGHPEGSVGRHTVEVLANVERYARDPVEREELRLVALFHDACKYRCHSGGPHHGALARTLAERYLDDDRLLFVIEHHDDAFHLYRQAQRSSGSDIRLLAELTEELRSLQASDLFLQFFRCDARTGDKSPAPLLWFEQQSGAVPTIYQGDAV